MLDKSIVTTVGQTDNFSPEEIARFDQFAESWWDTEGSYRNVLAFNNQRWQTIHKQCLAHFRVTQSDSVYEGKSVLDIGCGGGLLCEPFAKFGANVTGVDASQLSIEVAKRHALKSGLHIDYRHGLAEQLISEQKRYDVVLNTEVIEHVPDQIALVQECAKLLKPGGLMVMATLNRTIKSFFIGIVGAEYVLRMLPIGTHDWRKFVKPDELESWLQQSNVDTKSIVGLSYNPLNRKWKQTYDTSVNYMLFATSKS